MGSLAYHFISFQQEQHNPEPIQIHPWIMISLLTCRTAIAPIALPMAAWIVLCGQTVGTCVNLHASMSAMACQAMVGQTHSRNVANKGVEMEDVLILDREHVAELRLIVTRHGLRIMQEASPWVILVEGEIDNFAVFENKKGIFSISTTLSSQNEAHLTPFNLTANEILFIKAWIHRKTLFKKNRPGDGCEWDSTGFSCP
ncbi:MAG: hypothetical protein G8237_00960 [Magnetococcales bacterium]|nr:hypothetical protein [Magnetococcales bacterium]